MLGMIRFGKPLWPNFHQSPFLQQAIQSRFERKRRMKALGCVVETAVGGGTRGGLPLGPFGYGGTKFNLNET